MTLAAIKNGALDFSKTPDSTYTNGNGIKTSLKPLVDKLISTIDISRGLPIAEAFTDNLIDNIKLISDYTFRMSEQGRADKQNLVSATESLESLSKIRDLPKVFSDVISELCYAVNSLETNNIEVAKSFILQATKCLDKK